MFNVKNGLAALYEVDFNGIYESINNESDYCRSVLNKSGFTVTLDEHPKQYEAAQTLIAVKGSVVLEISHLFRGGKNISVIMRDGEHEKTLRLFTDSLEMAIAYADAVQYLAE